MAKRIQKKSKNIQVLVVDTISVVDNIKLPDLIALLPSNLRSRALRYRNKRSSINYCFGRLMLMQAIAALDMPSGMINKVYYSDNEKPFLDGFYFSISHSENIVSLAYSLNCQLGLDIETIKKVELKNFKSFFREDEWQEINSASDPLQEFYWYWVRKESILKAVDGKMNEINDVFVTSFKNGYFKNEENSWNLHTLELGNNIIGTIAHDCEKVDFNISSFELHL